jgi:hypothetical protein
VTNEDSRRIASVVRVSEFGKTWQLDTPPYGAVLKRLHAAAERLPWLAIEQQNAHSQWQGDSHVLDLLRIDLRRKHLMKYGPMGKDAFKHVTGAEKVFTVPDARVSIPALIAFADAMAKFIEKHMEGFLALEQPPDLVDRMRAATDQLRVHHRSIEESIAPGGCVCGTCAGSTGGAQGHQDPGRTSRGSPRRRRQVRDAMA